MQKTFRNAKSFYTIDVKAGVDYATFEMEKKAVDVELLTGNASDIIVSLNGRKHRCHVFRDRDTVYLYAFNRHWRFDDITELAEVDLDGDSGSGGGIVVAPMPGSVIKVLVREGEEVNRNQPLAIVEAMKMENEVYAAADAIVSKVLVSAGQQVGAGDVLIELSQPESDEENAAG